MAPTPSEVLSHMADRADKGGAPVPIGGDIMGLLVTLASISVLSICLCKKPHPTSVTSCVGPNNYLTAADESADQRYTAIKVWNNLPLVVWRKSLFAPRGSATVCGTNTTCSCVRYLHRLHAFRRRHNHFAANLWR